MRRLLLAIAAVIVVGSLVAGCGDEESEDGGVLDRTPKDLSGDWSGRLTQKGLSPFEVAVRFDPSGLDGRPAVAYTGIDCGGTWSSAGVLTSNPPFYLFKEEIDQGSGGECKGSGRVRIHPLEPCRRPKTNECGYRHLLYRFIGGGVTSTGVLTPARDDELSRIFEQAGVELGG